MSEYRFRLIPGTIPLPILQKSFFAGWGHVPRPTKIQVEGDEIQVQSNGKGSGTFHVPWPSRQLGILVESTDSLLPRSRPYCLLKELGRGALGRLNRKLFEWQTLGFRPSTEIRVRIKNVSLAFSKAVVSDESEPDIQKEFVFLLEQFDQLTIELAHQFTEQSLSWRLRAGEKLPIQFGVGMNSPSVESLFEFDLFAPFLRDAFHTVLPMPSWRELEPEPGVFCWEKLERRLVNPIRYGFHVVMGPLLVFDISTFPAWILPHLGEEKFFEQRASAYVEAVAERYGSLASSWILSSQTNSHSIPKFTVARGITLVRHLAKSLRKRGIDTTLMVGIDRPWGEYGLEQSQEFDLVQVAESLMGCHEIDAFLVELNIGLNAHFTFPRDPMSISGMIDQWSFLGKKVYVSFSIPSSAASDSQTMNESIPPELRWSEGLQQSWTELILSTLLAKRTVHGIFWSHLQDSEESMEDTKSLEPAMFSHGGLIDSGRVLKLAFNHFKMLKNSLLK